MTEKQFWAKLERYGTDKDSVFELIKTIHKAYEQDLGLICGCIHTGPDIVNQLYVNINEKEPYREGNRYMLCYTSVAMGKADPMLPEPCEKLPVRFVIDNMMNKPVIGGLIFNRFSKEKGFVIPKQLLAKGPAFYDTVKSIFVNRPNPFNVPWEDE